MVNLGMVDPIALLSCTENPIVDKSARARTWIAADYHPAPACRHGFGATFFGKILRLITSVSNEKTTHFWLMHKLKSLRIIDNHGTTTWLTSWTLSKN